MCTLIIDLIFQHNFIFTIIHIPLMWHNNIYFTSYNLIKKMSVKRQKVMSSLVNDTILCYDYYYFVVFYVKCDGVKINFNK